MSTANPFDLTGRIALVTGAARGLGHAIAAGLARAGATVVLNGRDRVVVTTPARPTPFAFPLMVEMFREKLSTEALASRVARMVAELERAAGG